MAGEAPTWEYLTVTGEPETHLATLGQEGWELVAVTGGAEEATLYFKRPGLTFRERVTLDQRRRYYAALGQSPASPEERAP